LPDPDHALQAWIRGEIDDDLLDCWAKANCQLPGPFHKIRDAHRGRFTQDQILQLWRREKIADGDLNGRLRKIGFTQQRDYDESRELAKLIPPYSDIVRMMIRDSGDETIVDWPDSDRIFLEKYTGQLQRWGKDQGLSDEAAKLLWRAHWTIPSPGQLLDFYHRLRKLPVGDAARVTIEEVRASLLQQDILPRWIDKFIAVSYRPMGRIDLRRSYAVGTTTEQELVDGFTQLGYSDEVAEKLKQFTKQQVRVSLLNSREVRLYQSGGSNRAETIERLVSRGVSGDDASWVIDRAIRDLGFASRAVCVRGIRRRYLTGDLDATETEAELHVLGLDKTQIDLFINAWSCESAKRGPVAQSATLCQWLDAGLITGEEMLRRLVKLGWEVDDASRHVSVCERRIGVKLEREESKRRRDEASRLAREERERARQEKDLLARAAKGERAALQMRAANERRDGLMLSAAKRLATQLQLPVTSTSLLVRDAVKFVKTTYLKTTDEAIRSAVLASETCKGKTCEEFIALAEQYSIAEQTVEPEH
jgi:hypothetical protein